MNSGIVITVYNKEKEINSSFLERFISICENIHVCFVNNGSTDGTLSILELFQEKFPQQISIVTIRNNKGDESAIKAGFRYLLNKKNLTKVGFSNNLNYDELRYYSDLSNKFIVEK